MLQKPLFCLPQDRAPAAIAPAGTVGQRSRPPRDAPEGPPARTRTSRPGLRRHQPPLTGHRARTSRRPPAGPARGPATALVTRQQPRPAGHPGHQEAQTPGTHTGHPMATTCGPIGSTGAQRRPARHCRLPGLSGLPGISALATFCGLPDQPGPWAPVRPGRQQPYRSRPHDRGQTDRGRRPRQPARHLPVSPQAPCRHAAGTLQARHRQRPGPPKPLTGTPQVPRDADTWRPPYGHLYRTAPRPVAGARVHCAPRFRGPAPGSKTFHGTGTPAAMPQDHRHPTVLL